MFPFIKETPTLPQKPISRLQRKKIDQILCSNALFYVLSAARVFVDIPWARV
jgi:hypothetical protein